MSDLYAILRTLMGQQEARHKEDTLRPGKSQLHYVPRIQKLTDDYIEHFLVTFEGADGLGFSICYPLLTGKARGAYVHMDLDDAQDYDIIKPAILTKLTSMEVNPEESPRELHVGSNLEVREI
ncbi:hypothetical protein Q5P01_013338 [Channa striata]|uniref:Uncharacterized protein n=1 Tax=Channa striata TaxID=64152 RepID=A0AA88MJZ7_CHASR|nr:hypothetical protein Q5P01_013338 [Channa striata]